MRHDRLIDEVVQSLRKSGLKTYRIDHRTVPDAICSETEVYAIEVESRHPSRKIKNLKKTDFRKTIILYENYLEKYREREQLRKAGKELLEQGLRTTAIQQELYRQFGKIVPLSTISTWRAKLHN